MSIDLLFLKTIFVKKGENMQYKNTLLAVLLTALSNITFAQAMDNAVIYKYKDAKGRTIYSDNIPSNEKGQYAVLSGKSGVLKQVVERELTSEEIEVINQKKAQEKNELDKNVEQRKRDNSLLATYSSIDEITKLKNFELAQINQAIKTQIGNITDLKDKINQASDNVSANPNNKKMKENLQDLQSKLSDANNILDNNKSLLETRTKKYQEDETRYVQLLKEMSTKKSENQK